MDPGLLQNTIGPDTRKVYCHVALVKPTTFFKIASTKDISERRPYCVIGFGRFTHTRG
jgi:hypothetical protein